MSKIEKKKYNEFQKVNRNVDGRNSIYRHAEFGSSTQHNWKDNQIHFDRSIDSEWLEENQIPKKNRSAAQSMSIFTNALAVDDDAEPF